MRAKLVREIPQREGLPYWFRKYEFECIDCGEHYFSGRYDRRTAPYCASCRRKHEREKQKHYQEQKKQRAINEVLDKIRAEIARKAYSGQWSEATVYGMQKSIAIIDKYRQEG